MPIAAIAPIIAAGIGVGGTLLGQHSANNAARDAQQRATTDPINVAQAGLIQQQTEMSRWGFGEAKNLFPQARASIDLPFEHYKAILSGNPAEFNRMLAGSNQAVDQQMNMARRNISNFSPRGAQAGQIAQIATQGAQAKQSNYFQAYLNALSGAQSSATQYGNMFNSLLAGGQGTASSALGALTSQLGFQTQRDLQSQQLRAQSMANLGQGIGQILSAVLLGRGGSGGGGGGGGGGGSSSSGGGDGGWGGF